MSNPRQRPKASHLEVRRLETSLPFAELAGEVERRLAEHPGLGLFPDPGEDLIRVGGLGLRGDFLIRRARPGRDGLLLAASRWGDRAAFASFAEAMGGAWRPSEGMPAADEGLSLLNFLQGDVLFECARHVAIGPRALEDAFSCRFDGLDRLRLRLAELNGEAMRARDVIKMIICDEGGAIWEAMPAAALRVLHEGLPVHLDRVEEVRSGRGTLWLRAKVLARRRLCLVGSLGARP